MQHLEEGTIHAWLDGALSADESTAASDHVTKCARCAEAVAEARGLIAASSRILSALDVVPSGVIPDFRKESGAIQSGDRDRERISGSRNTVTSGPQSGTSSGFWMRRPGLRAAAGLAMAAAGVFWIVRQAPHSQFGDTAQRNAMTQSEARHPDSIAAAQRLGPSSDNLLGSGASSADTWTEQAQEMQARVTEMPKAQGYGNTQRQADESVTARTSNGQPAPSVRANNAESPQTATHPSTQTSNDKVGQGETTQTAQRSERAMAKDAMPQNAPAADISQSAAALSQSPVIATADSPALSRKYTCVGATVDVYAIGSSKSVTLITTPDTIAIREPTTSLKTMRRVDDSRSSGPSPLVPGLASCTPDIKRIATPDSTARLLRWTDRDRRAAYLLFGSVAIDTLNRVRSALSKRE